MRLNPLRGLSRPLSLSILAALIGAIIVKGEAPSEPAETAPEASAALSGEELSRKHCVTCHVYTEPDLLPRKSWNFLLTYMGMRLGIDDASYLGELSPIEEEVIRTRRSSLSNEGLVPGAPVLPDADWKRLRQYYMEAAPENALAPEEKPAIEGVASLFEKKEHAYQFKGALTTMVRIDAANRQILIGDSRNQEFTLLNHRIEPVESYPTQNAYWVDAELTGDGVFLLSVGDIPSAFVQEKLGGIAFGWRDGSAYGSLGLVLKNLYRPTDMKLSDMDNDGIDEILVCNFGDEGGDFSIYGRGRSKGGFSEVPLKTLYEGTGPIKCETHDFNGDGLLDIVLLISDVKERLVLYSSKGDGEYEETTIVEAHPSWGYIGLQLADINGDGHMDVLTGNGDNVDSDPYNTLKRFHGIRVYLNDGESNFAEGFFYPMRGAYEVQAHDYDMDGDTDIAANSFYPDFDQRPLENFVYLEQTAPMEFTPRRHPATEEGRWVCMDAGDLDGDGDIDIALGGAYLNLGMDDGNSELFAEWLEKGSPLLILENQTVP